MVVMGLAGRLPRAVVGSEALLLERTFSRRGRSILFVRSIEVDASSLKRRERRAAVCNALHCTAMRCIAMQCHVM